VNTRGGPALRWEIRRVGALADGQADPRNQSDTGGGA